MARKRIGDLLFEAGLITSEQLEQALETQKRTKERLGDVLIGLEFVTEAQLIEVLEFQLGIPHVSLARQRIDPAALALVPESLAKRYQVLPLRQDRHQLVVAMADPLDYYALDDLRMSTGFQISPVLAAREELRAYVDRYYGMRESVDEVLHALSLREAQTFAEPDVAADDSPIARLVNQILNRAVSERASDVHFDPAPDGLRVRMRIDGQLRSEQTLPAHAQRVVTARLKIMAGLNIAEHRLPQDGRMRFSVEGREVDIRVASLPTVHGEKTVLRILDASANLQAVDKLGFSPRNLRLFERLLTHESGMVVITGPTGSGKTTTVYAALTRISTPEVNAISIEDPVEYRLAGVNQVAVNTVAGMTFARGLRAILRQDPDVVMVGEIRDAETAEIAIRAALTGHLVLSTLHTRDAPSTITRLADMGIERYLIASAVTGIVAQRLVRQVCPHCKAPHTPTEYELEGLDRYGVQCAAPVAGEGCGYCARTGYRGRVAIQEVMQIDDNIRNLIVRGATEAELRAATRPTGYQDLIVDGLEKAAMGKTTLAEVLRVALRE